MCPTPNHLNGLSLARPRSSARPGLVTGAAGETTAGCDGTGALKGADAPRGGVAAEDATAGGSGWLLAIAMPGGVAAMVGAAGGAVGSAATVWAGSAPVAGARGAVSLELALRSKR